MPYYLTHPEHGTHICYTPEDVEAHKLIGWVPAWTPETIAEARNDIEPPKKRGRKPKVNHGD
jgi:hypothetical protein